MPFVSRSRLVVASLSLLALVPTPPLRAQAVDPRATFYRLDAIDNGAAPVFLDLTSYADGTLLYLFPRGRFTVGPSGSGEIKDARTSPYGFVGAFTSDAALGAASLIQRINTVPSGQPDAVVGPSFYEGVDRNILNDFRIAGDVFPVIKPVGASYLAIGLVDDAYRDNIARAPQYLRVYLSTSGTVDPDPGNCLGMAQYNTPCVAGDVLPARSVAPEPGTLALLGAGLISLGIISKRRRSAE